MNRPPRLLMGISLAIIGIVLLLTILFLRPVSTAIFIQTSGQPTIGAIDAPVTVVVFEEPRCHECIRYNLTIFPKIKEKYIDTGKVRYTAIPVSFLPHTIRIGEALLCASFQNPDFYFDFLHYVHQHLPSESEEWKNVKLILQWAKQANPRIKLDEINHCISYHRYIDQILLNTDYGRKIMGGRIATPTVYVNGIKLEEVSLKNMEALIQKVLKKRS